MERASFIENIDPKITVKPVVRCAECDREVDSYNTFVGPTNAKRNVCWRCLSRLEKGFNARPGFRRGARQGYIPR